MQIRVRVTADSKKQKVEQVSEFEYKIFVQEKALQNAANYAVRQLLARELKVDITQVRLVGGHRKPSKLFEIKLVTN